MRLLTRCASTIGVLALIAHPLTAQTSQRFSIQASGLGAQAFGDSPVLDNVKFGYGFEAQVRYTPSAFSIGVGFQWTTHKQTLFDNNPAIDPTQLQINSGSRTKLYGGFIEPRYVIAAGSNTMAPYVSARVSILKQSTSADGNVITVNPPVPFDVKADATGFNINGGGGLLFRLTDRVNLDVGATFGWTDYGNLKVTVTDGTGGTVTGESETQSGTNLVLRLGLAVGIGG